MKRLIVSGINVDEDSYTFDYETNTPEDLINLVTPYLYKSSLGGNTYYFGYKFNPDVKSAERTRFIKYIKGLSGSKISKEDLDKFIYNPLAELNRQINLYHIDCFVYPVSERSQFVSEMIKVIGDYTSRNMNSLSYTLVKSIPEDVKIDCERLNREFADDPNRLKQMTENIKTKIEPKLKGLDYFSIAQAINTKYRRFITNFLNMPESQLDKIKQLSQNQNILIVDDINTSGSTLQEILRIIREVNPDCNIYIYTLIGK